MKRQPPALLFAEVFELPNRLFKLFARAKRIAQRNGEITIDAVGHEPL